MGSPAVGSGLLQFWRCEEGAAPIFMFGLGHRHGRVWELAWCPSGGGGPGRLGLLAAACSDGTVRVWAVPQPAAMAEGALYSGEPVLSLQCGGAGPGQALGLSWHRGPGHRHLAACFASGLVAVWDLATTSRLLRPSPAALLPHHAWAAHTGSATGVSLRPDQEELPRYLVTGGSDRHYRCWDLRDTSVPIQEVKRGLVTGVSWLPGWAAASVCYDEVYLQSHTQTLLAEMGCSSTGSQPIISQNSGVWGLDTSHWAAAVAVGTAAGELIVFVVPPSDRSMEHDKNVSQRRTYVYRTELELEPAGEEQEYREEQKEYDAVRGATIRFRDLAAGQSEETRRVRCAEKMDTEELTCYPLAAVTRVAWNQNLGSHLRLASGGQAGLVRLLNLRQLDTAPFRKAITEARAAGGDR
jgi:general transcription factor 3C polypeptide 2